MAGEIVPLETLPKGSKGVVVYLPEKPGLRNRLMQMGVLPGTEVEVVENNTYGPLILRVRGVTIGVGRRIARRILVRKID